MTITRTAVNSTLFLGGGAGDVKALANAATPRIVAIDRYSGGSVATTLTAGRLFFVAFSPIKTMSISTLAFNNRGTAAVGTTLARMGLFTVADNGNATLVARTASDTSLASVTFTLYTGALDTTGGYPASYTVTAGSRYAFGILFVGSSTAPSVYGYAGGSAMNFWLPWLTAGVSAQTDIGTLYTFASDLTREPTAPLMAGF